MASSHPTPSPSPSPSRVGGHSRSASSSTNYLSTQAPTPKPSAPPVNIFPSPAARLYSYVHPVLLVTVYVASFPSLVADPITKLLNDLPLLSVLQIAYVMVCLPPAGAVSSSSSQSRLADGDGGGDSEKSPKKSPASPAPGLAVRSGKVRRKHAHHKSSGSRISAKLTVCKSTIKCLFEMANPFLSAACLLFLDAHLLASHTHPSSAACSVRGTVNDPHHSHGLMR